MCLVVGVCVAVVLLSGNVFAAERYISKDFPPTEIIKIFIKNKIRNLQITEFLGKQKTTDNTYVFYYNYKGVFAHQSRGIYIGSLTIIKLDTDLWIIKNAAFDFSGVLTK